MATAPHDARMNFLCPQCQAKYRIADEKVAGRDSAKMKCRKCGFIIDVQVVARVESVKPPPQSAPPARIAPPAAAPPAPPVPGPEVAEPASKRAPTPRRSVPAPPRREATAGAAPAGRADLPATPPLREPEAALPRLAPPPVLPSAPAVTPPAPLATAINESLRPAAVADEWFVGIADSPIGPLSIDELRARVDKREVTRESLVWRDGMGSWKPLGEVPELALISASAGLPSLPRLPPPISSPTASVPVVSESPESMLQRFGGRPRRHGPHPVTWVAVVVALALGVTIGVVFFKGEPREVVRYVEVPASARPEPSTATSATEVAVAPAEPAASQAAQDAPRKAAGAPRGETPAAPGKGGLTGLASLGGLPPAAGPTAGSTDDVASRSSAGGQLDSGSIQRVVANFTPGVRRGCWQPALEARSPDAPASARVAMTMTVSPGGEVVSASAGADPRGYPGLARCIEGKVRAWKFPASSGTTTVQVPFVFAAQ